MRPTTVAIGTAYVLGVVGIVGFGIANANAQGGALGGVIVGVFSAIAWALSTLGNATWNPRLNLYAALFAACSLGLLAPVDKLCAGAVLSFLCR